AIYVRIERGRDPHGEARLSVVVEIVERGDFVHEIDMAAIFTVAEPGCRLEHRLDGGIGAAALRFVLGVEYDQRDVDHAALPDDDRRRIVEAALVEHASGEVA